MRVVLNSLRVLEEVARCEPVSLARLHRNLGIPKTTVHRALQTLAEGGWAHCRPNDGRWRLTSRAAVLSVQAASTGGLRELALPLMRKLRDESGKAIHLSVAAGPEVALIERVDGPRMARTCGLLGTRTPLHASAGGRAILATRSSEEVEAVLRGALAPSPPEAATGRLGLFEAVRRARQAGYAVDRGELVPDVATVAAAIVGPSGRGIAAVGVSAPLQRLPKGFVDRIGPRVRTTAEAISSHLGDGPDPLAWEEPT